MTEFITLLLDADDAEKRAKKGRSTGKVRFTKGLLLLLLKC